MMRQDTATNSARGEPLPFEEAVHGPYPVIRTPRTFPVGAGAARTVENTLACFEECLAAAIAAASSGQCVLIGNERLLYDETGLSRCR